MTRVLRFGVLLLLATGTLAGPQVSAQPYDKQQRLEERLTALSAAFNAADVPTLKTLLSEHYSHTNNGATPLDREAWLKSIEKRRADMDSGVLAITDVQISDVEVKTQNDTAVATGLYLMKGRRAGKDFGLKIRYTQVWEWDGHDWFRVAFHDTYGPIED